MISYLKARQRGFWLLMVTALIFISVFALYGLPWQAALYGGAVAGLALLAAICADYARYRGRRAQLHQALGEITLTLDALPPPLDGLEAEYQALIRALFDARQREMGEAGRRYRALTEYFARWAHEVKTPIAGMRLVLEEPAPEKRLIREELFQIEQYVGMALAFLQLGGDSTDFVLKNCPLDPIIRQAVRKFAPQFIRKKLRLVYEPVGRSALTDEKWLSFVLEQVLSNAIKYTSEGGVTIRLDEPLTLVVEDTGIGVAPEDLPRIFERGYTGLNGRADKSATGIGLYLCRAVMRKLGHEIAAESEPGRGTRIRLMLEAAKLEVE